MFHIKHQITDQRFSIFYSHRFFDGILLLRKRLEFLLLWSVWAFHFNCIEIAWRLFTHLQLSLFQTVCTISLCLVNNYCFSNVNKSWTAKKMILLYHHKSFYILTLLLDKYTDEISVMKPGVLKEMKVRWKTDTVIPGKNSSKGNYLKA